MRKVHKAIVPLVSLALVAAACGGDDDDDAAEEPAAEEPAAEEPAAEEPAAEDPAAEILTDVGVDDETIRIGLNAGLSGLFASTVTPIVEGQEVYWEIVNDNGGIAGRQVELVILDNEYDVPKHLENYEAMADTGDEGVVMFSQSTGSPHTAATSEMLVEDDLLAIPLSWYSGWADPGVVGENVMELYTSYCFESMNGVEYLKDENDASTIAIVSFPGEYGQDGAQGAKIAAEALGLEVVYDGEGLVVPGADQTPVITELVAADPDIVWTTLNGGHLADIMGQSYAQGLRAVWSGNSPSWDPNLLGTDVGPVLDELYRVSTYTALWAAVETPGMDELIAGMREKRPDAQIEDTYIVAWTEGMATKALLEQAAANGDMTRAGVVAALQDVTVDFQGLAPTQSWSGEPNDYVVRESYIYDVDISLYNPDATVSDDAPGATGVSLLEGPYVGSVAQDYTFTEACFSTG